MPYKDLLLEHRIMQPNLKIMIFTEGTVLGPKNVLGLYFHADYIPIGNCVDKIRSWENQGAEISYFTSRKTEKQVNKILYLLNKYHFVGTYLYYREKNQKFKDIIEQVKPDILIEDDCKSIGGQLWNWWNN